MFRTMIHITEASAGGNAKLGAPAVAWRTFRSQGDLSSGSCSLCWWPQTVESRGNTFKSVLLKLNSSVLSLGHCVENKEAGVTIFFYIWCRYRLVYMLHPKTLNYIKLFSSFIIQMIFFLSCMGCMICVTASMWSVYITALQPWRTHIFLFALAMISFSLCVCLDWSAIKTPASPLLLPLFPLPPPHYDHCLDFSGISMRDLCLSIEN